MTLTLAGFIGHWLPFWLPLVLAIIPWVIEWVLAANSPTTAAAMRSSRNYAAEFILAMLAFWMWALTTNAHSQRLARSSGSDAGNQKKRSDEFAIILLCLLLSILAYLACFAMPGPSLLIPPSVAVIMPIAFMVT